MLLGGATAWAGRGDVDPNYGEGGRLQIPPGVVIALPGDRLVIADGGTGEGFRVRMVDATGQNVLSFGDDGIALIDSSAAARAFLPEAAALASNGDMIFMGTLSDTPTRALLRLDQDGQPVLSFGDRGDGLAEPAVTTTGAMAFAVAPDGKIFVAEGSWNPDGSCENTARLQRLLDNGQPDTGFGVDGIVEIQNLDICNGAPVFGARPDGGVIIGHGQTMVAIDAAGDIDSTFGVDGRLVVNEVAWPSGVLLDPDGEHVVAALSVSRADGSHACSGVARLTFDGTPDTGFGRNGLTCLNFDFTLTAVQSDGAPLFFEGYNGAMHRLLPDNSPSKGMLRVATTSFAVGESAGTATVAIERVAGRDGAVSVSFATGQAASIRHPCGYHYCVTAAATPGSDYEAVSGQLDWASGDDSQHTVTVRILNDDIDEVPERFGVDFSEPGGGVELIAPLLYINIADDDETAATAPPPPPPPSGGGGSVSWTTHLALLTLLFVGRRRIRRADSSGR